MILIPEKIAIQVESLFSRGSFFSQHCIFYAFSWQSWRCSFCRWTSIFLTMSQAIMTCIHWHSHLVYMTGNCAIRSLMLLNSIFSGNVLVLSISVPLSDLVDITLETSFTSIDKTLLAKILDNRHSTDFLSVVFFSHFKRMCRQNRSVCSVVFMRSKEHAFRFSGPYSRLV